VPGYDSNAILTNEIANDPKFWKAMAGAESGRRGSLSDEQINQALEMEKAGSAAAYERANPQFVQQNQGTLPPVPPPTPPTGVDDRAICWAGANGAGAARSDGAGHQRSRRGPVCDLAKGERGRARGRPTGR
jgi:hypothetical protein